MLGSQFLRSFQTGSSPISFLNNQPNSQLRLTMAASHWRPPVDPQVSLGRWKIARTLPLVTNQILLVPCARATTFSHRSASGLGGIAGFGASVPQVINLDSCLKRFLRVPSCPLWLRLLISKKERTAKAVPRGFPLGTGYSVLATFLSASPPPGQNPRGLSIRS